MGLFDNNDGSAVKAQAPNSEVVSKELPKLVIEPGGAGIPRLKVSQPQYRYTKEETGQHPLADRADAVLPPKYKGDHTFDPTTRVFEPSSARSDTTNERATFGENLLSVNPGIKHQESSNQTASPLQMPERSLFGGGSSGGDSSLKGPELSSQKSFSSLFEPSRPKGNGDGSLFVIIIASLVVLLGSILKLLATVFWPWVNRLNFRRRRFSKASLRR